MANLEEYALTVLTDPKSTYSSGSCLTGRSTSHTYVSSIRGSRMVSRTRKVAIEPVAISEKTESHP